MKATDIWPIARLIALLMQVPGMMAVISCVVALSVGDNLSAVAFGATAVIVVGLGAVMYWLIPQGHQPDFRETMVGGAAGWLVAALIGTLPFLLVARWSPTDVDGSVQVLGGFWNAFFEAMSGFTTTGMTMVDRPDALPLGLQWWRSFMQWIGGLGVIILVLAVVHPEQDLSKLFRAEGHERSFGHSVMATIRETWAVYAGFTLVGAVLLWFLGMPVWASLNHAMTAVSTGGFTITNDGLASYGAGQRLGVTILTILGAISFIWYQHLLHRNWSKTWSDIQIRTLFGVLVFGALLVVLARIAEGSAINWLDVVLQWTAAVTTSGFSSSGLEDWSGAQKFLLILAMVAGGSTGSAAGGVKLARVVLLLQEVGGFLRQIMVKPWLFVFRPATLFGEIDEGHAGQLTVAGLFLVMWIGLISFFGFLIAVMAGPDAALTDVMFDVTSALSITGLSTGIASPELDAGGKAVFILLMWMGRLEVLPILVFFAWIARPRIQVQDSKAPK